MIHHPPKNFLYSSYRLDLVHYDSTSDTTKSSSATAFIIDVSGAPWIITNRHVIDLDYKQDSAKYKNFKLTEIKLMGRLPNDSTYELIINPDVKTMHHSDHLNDVAIIEPKITGDSAKVVHYHFDVNHLADENAFKNITPFDEICFTGFPEEHDKFSDRPILRRGSIASDPCYDYTWNKTPQGKCIAYEGFSSPVASGSPIFAPARGLKGIENSRNGYLIGVNAGQVLTSTGHKGISYFYKSTCILDILKENKIMK